MVFLPLFRSTCASTNKSNKSLLFGDGDWYRPCFFTTALIIAVVGGSSGGGGGGSLPFVIPVADALEYYMHDDYYQCLNDTYGTIGGSSPVTKDMVCNPSASPFISNQTSCVYNIARKGFSKFFTTFPIYNFYPLVPYPQNIKYLTALERDPSDPDVSRNEDLILASDEDMNQATTAVELFMQCTATTPGNDDDDRDDDDDDDTNTLLPFTVLCGGHSNAGASVSLNQRILNLRYMDRVEMNLNESLLGTDPNGNTKVDIGSIHVGAGATAGRAAAIAYTQSYKKNYSSYAFLPVGQRPTVGISGLTLGGGFGFLTRYAGLLCDRLKSVQAIIPTTPDGVVKTVTATNEYSDLFWASCGGGGGNFAVITDFEFNPVEVFCVPGEDILGCNVLELEYQFEASAEMVMFYQEWSMKMSTRITPNLEVHNATHLAITGIFMGNETMFEEAIDLSGLTESTPLKASALKKYVTSTSLPQATTDLTGWTPDSTPLALLRSFREERSYFMYKSYWLFEPLPQAAVDILIKKAMKFVDKDTFVVFEYQALGGNPANDIENYPKYLSPQNLFAAKNAKDTAFPHRGAKHCLMFKVQASDEAVGDNLLNYLQRVYVEITPYVKGQASYYNHIDASKALETPYFVHGVELNPGVTEDDKDHWLSRFQEIRAKYNPLGLMVNKMGVGNLLPQKSTDPKSDGDDDKDDDKDELSEKNSNVDDSGTSEAASDNEIDSSSAAAGMTETLYCTLFCRLVMTTVVVFSSLYLHE